MMDLSRFVEGNVAVVEKCRESLSTEFQVAIQSLTANVEMLRRFALFTLSLYKEKKFLIKPLHLYKRREAACGLAKPCRDVFSTFPLQIYKSLYSSPKGRFHA
jgi:hypothetical protein